MKKALSGVMVLMLIMLTACGSGNDNILSLKGDASLEFELEETKEACITKILAADMEDLALFINDCMKIKGELTTIQLWFEDDVLENISYNIVIEDRNDIEKIIDYCNDIFGDADFSDIDLFYEGEEVANMAWKSDEYGVLVTVVYSDYSRYLSILLRKR
jgi:hypothetical protein